MFYQVPPQQFKAFVVPVEQNNIVFFNKLERLDGLGGHGLDLLIMVLKTELDRPTQLGTGP